MKKAILLLTLFSVLLFSCKDDDQDGSGEQGKNQFSLLQFDNDVLEANVSTSMIVYTTGFGNDADKWEVSVINKTTNQQSSALAVSNILTSKEKAERLTISVPPLAEGDYNLVIKNKNTKQIQKFDFIARHNVESHLLYTNESGGIQDLETEYGYFVDNTKYSIYFNYDVLNLRAQKLNLDVRQEVFLQNKQTNELIQIDSHKSEYSLQFSLPKEIASGYYYVWAEDAEANKIFSKKAILIDNILDGISIEAKQTKTTRDIENGLFPNPEPFRFKSGESIVISGKSIFYRPDKSLLPQPYSFNVNEPIIEWEWNEDPSKSLPVSMNKENNEIRIQIPKKGQEGYDNRPYSDDEGKLFNGFLTLRKPSVAVFVSIDYN